MAFKCQTWVVEDGFKYGPRPAPVMDNRATDRGLARQFEVHASLLHKKRVLLMTRLCCRGPAMAVDLSRELDWELGHLGVVLRGMTAGHVVESFPACRRLGDREEGLRGDRRGHTGRVWHATETGRWSLWRAGWIARSLAYAPWSDPPLMEEAPDDPVEAVRAGVRQEFLRPVSLVILQVMNGVRSASMRSLAVGAGLPMGHVSQRIRAWERLGWVEEDPERRSWPFQGRTWPTWRPTHAGDMALLRHADALRRAARACGWEPTPGGVTYAKERWDTLHAHIRLEEEFLRSGWKL